MAKMSLHPLPHPPPHTPPPPPPPSVPSPTPASFDPLPLPCLAPLRRRAHCCSRSSTNQAVPPPDPPPSTQVVTGFGLPLLVTEQSSLVPPRRLVADGVLEVPQSGKSMGPQVAIHGVLQGGTHGLARWMTRFTLPEPGRRWSRPRLASRHHCPPRPRSVLDMPTLSLATIGSALHKHVAGLVNCSCAQASRVVLWQGHRLRPPPPELY
jgi:hypothetical protein